MIGRKKEITELNRLFDSKKAELVAIYGRRRVGKTYLINETFKDKIVFKHTGLSNVEKDNSGLLKRQLKEFYYSLLNYKAKPKQAPKDWFEAFFLLEEFLNSFNDNKRIVIFIDEFPWLDTPRSHFISAFESFWNNYACAKNNLMVIVCGSASSYILDNLINNHGGLYGRVTYRMKLTPFKLKECEEFLKFNSINYSKYDVTQTYMCLGGIPYYLSYLRNDLSFAQNIDNLFFNENARLNDEYNLLFSSIFEKPEIMKKIVSFLFTKKIGYSRNEIADKLKLTNNGKLGEYLSALIASDFIIEYIPFKEKKTRLYKLVDNFSIFYLSFIENKTIQNNYFSLNVDSPKLSTWKGYSFENVCFNHINEIKKTLLIEGVTTSVSSFNYRGDKEKGTQIDLLLIRNDNIINLCEIKFYKDEFIINKDYYLNLIHKNNVLSELINKKQSIQNVSITSFGIKNNEYKYFFVKNIVLEDLFN